MREHHQYYHKEFVLEDASTLIVDFDFIPDPIEPADEQSLRLFPASVKPAAAQIPTSGSLDADTENPAKQAKTALVGLRIPMCMMLPTSSGGLTSTKKT